MRKAKKAPSELVAGGSRPLTVCVRALETGGEGVSSQMREKDGQLQMTPWGTSAEEGAGG